MDYINKVQKVRENIHYWQKEHGDEFTYITSGFYIGDEMNEESTVISPLEHKEIVQYLSRRKFLEILKENFDSFRVKISPSANPTIKLKTLELIARELKDSYTGTEIISFLKNCGVDEKLIVYPDSKWSIFYRVFHELSISQDEQAKKLLFKVLAESVHPLNLGGDETASELFIKKFNEYLKYDNFEITHVDALHLAVKEKVKSFTAEEDAEYKAYLEQSDQNDFEEQEQIELHLLRQPKAMEMISRLRKSYQTLTNLIEVFCGNPSEPTTELNNAYIRLKTTIFDTISSLGLLRKAFYIYSFSKYKDESYSIPFSNLFSAEKDFRDKHMMLSWDSIRPKMNAMYGEIDQLYQAVNASDVLSEPDEQTQINKVMLLLSETKEQNEKNLEAKQKKFMSRIPTQKIEITSIPELQIKNAVEENTLTKGKKQIHLPKFKPTDWSKITIRFLNERSVLITSDKKEMTPTDYEALGFSDEKRDKPNMAWTFLWGLAQNHGETAVLKTPIPDNIKQQKRQLSDGLKKIFKNDTDPFYDPTETHTYKIKIDLVPPQSENDKPDKIGVQEYLDETMTEVYE